MPITEKLEIEIKKILKWYPVSITILELNESYKRKYKKDIAYLDFGYKSLEELVKDIPDINIERSGLKRLSRFDPSRHSFDESLRDLPSNEVSKNDSIYTNSEPKWKKKFKKLNFLLESQSKEEIKLMKIEVGTSDCQVPLTIQNNLKRIVAFFYDGLPYIQLLPAYQSCFEKTLDFRNYNYDSLLEMCMDLKDVFLCFAIRGEAVLFNKDDISAQYVNAHPTIIKSSTPQQRLAVQLLTSSFVKEMNAFDEFGYPLNVMKLSEKIPRQFIPKNKKIGKTIDVFVTEIYDPSKFWITLEQDLPKFQEMHVNMQEWYGTCSSNFNIPQKLIKCGLYCVALYNSEYYRGIVVKQMNRCVKVFFIDFGTLSTIDKTQLTFLHKKFSQFPQQAIRARLAGIQPKVADTPWSEESCKEFLNLVCEKYMVATIAAKSDMLEVVVITLQDKEVTFCANDLLVTRKYAISDVEEQEKFFSNIVPSVKYIELYPTFYEIENGIVPTAEDTYTLLKSGMEYHYIFPHYFKNKTASDLTVPVPSATECCSRIDQSLGINISFLTNAICDIFTKDTTNIEKTVDIKEQLALLTYVNIRSGNIVPIYHIKHLLRENISMDSTFEVLFDTAKEIALSVSTNHLQDVIATVFDIFSIEVFLELYSFIIQTISNTKVIKQLRMTEEGYGKIFPNSDFNGKLINWYYISNQFYADVRELLQIVHLQEPSMEAVKNPIDMIDFVSSLLIISVNESPSLVQEFTEYNISFPEKLMFVKLEFIPRFFEIFAGVILPTSVLENLWKTYALCEST